MLSIYNILSPTPNKGSVKPDNILISDINESFSYKIINPETLVKSELNVNESFHKDNFGFLLSQNEIDNFKTHYDVWCNFIKNGGEHCVVIENHLNITIRLSNLIEIVNTDIPNDCDIFFPYDIEKLRERNNPDETTLLNPNLRENKYVQPYMHGYKLGTFFYIVTKRGCKVLLDTIKSINLTLDDEILHLILLNKANCYCSDLSWFSPKEAMHFELLGRKKKIWEFVNKNTFWDKMSLTKIRQLLKTISDIANSLNFDLILQGGTHLAFVRHKSIMPWDDDIDIGIDEQNITALINAINTTPGLSIEQFIERRTSTPYYKIWLDDGEDIVDHPYTFPFIDIWLYRTAGDDIIFNNGILCPNSLQEPLISIEFEGAEFKIPFNSLEILDTRYRDWRNRIRVYVYSHKLEKPHYYPINVDIEVDNNGKMRELNFEEKYSDH